MKDFVAKVEKAQDRTLENTVVAEAVASKVRGTQHTSRACELFTDIMSTELCCKDCLGVLLPKYPKRKQNKTNKQTNKKPTFLFRYEDLQKCLLVYG